MTVTELIDALQQMNQPDADVSVTISGPISGILDIQGVDSETSYRTVYLQAEPLGLTRETPDMRLRRAMQATAGQKKV